MIIYADEPCIDPLALAESLLAQDPPLPLEPWFGRANSFRSTLGCKTGRGMVIMSLDALTRMYDAGNDSRANILKFGDDAEPGLSLKGIIIEGYDAIAPGTANDRQQAMAVKLVDRRHVFAKIPINQAYNVRSSPGGAFTSATKNSGSDWTWSTMVGDIWGKVAGLGTFPGLPFTPDGTPEGWKFYGGGAGGKAMDALSSVFTRLACALKYDHLTDAFSIVRVGVASTTATANVNTLKQTLTRIWDSYTTEPKYANLPRAARVCFRKQPRPTDGTSDVYTIDVTDPVDTDLTQRLAGSVVQVWDDLTAYYVAGVLNNSAALTTRATERAADYFRALNAIYADSETYVYRGFQRKAIAAVGSLFLGWTLLDNGEGAKTELFRGPAIDGMMIEDWSPDGETLPTVSVTVYGKACPIFQTSDGSDGTANYVKGLTQEKYNVTFPAGTIISATTCVVSSNDCCIGNPVGDCVTIPGCVGSYCRTLKFTCVGSGGCACLGTVTVLAEYDDATKRWQGFIPPAAGTCAGTTVAIDIWYDTGSTDWKYYVKFANGSSQTGFITGATTCANLIGKSFNIDAPLGHPCAGLIVVTIAEETGCRCVGGLPTPVGLANDCCAETIPGSFPATVTAVSGAGYDLSCLVGREMLFVRPGTCSTGGTTEWYAVLEGYNENLWYITLQRGGVSPNCFWKIAYTNVALCSEFGMTATELASTCPVDPINSNIYYANCTLALTFSLNTTALPGICSSATLPDCVSSPQITIQIRIP